MGFNLTRNTTSYRCAARAAQRAFRERKQSQLAGLQARIQQYEQGEIERNVALQNIAKRLKEENEILRRENALLKEKLTKLEKDQEAAQEKKRWRDTSPNSVTSTRGPARKKSRFSPEALDKPLITSYISSPPSMVNSPDSTGTSDTRFSPVYEVQASEATHPIMTNIDFNTTTKPISLDPNTSFPTFDCGFCSEDTPCVCRELAAQQAADRSALSSFKSEEFTPTMAMPSNRVVRLEPAPLPQQSPRPSILDNLPAYQPPVPLRRRATPGTVNSVFPIQALPEAQPSNPPPVPTCSGDPSNCLACADDAFGKAFCSAIEKTVAARPPCVDPPRTDTSTSRGCCGSRCNCEHYASGSTLSPHNSYDTSETIPTNDAWRQIKAHPNVSFADLSLLASVVASRSKCTGPRIVLSPNLEHRPTPPPPPPADSETIILTDPHAQYREKEKAQLQGNMSSHLMPQDGLVRCTQHRICEVPTSAVRDALRLLDAKFS